MKKQDVALIILGVIIAKILAIIIAIVVSITVWLIFFSYLLEGK